MGITTEEFTHVAGHLADTLISLNVPQVIASMCSLILTLARQAVILAPAAEDEAGVGPAKPEGILEHDVCLH